MITKTIQIQEITVEELADIVAEKLVSKIEVYLKKYAAKDDDTIMTRTETANFLRISLVTLNSWSKSGILKPIRIGNRVFYKKQLILNYFK